MATIVRTPRPPKAQPLVLPADVRLMQATANALIVLAVVGAVLALGMWLLRQPGFAVRAVRVDGDVARNSVSTIRANATPKLTGNFFTMDLHAAQRAFESVPWVRHAVVQRIWPNRLAVHLEEHRPAALWVPAGEKDGGDQLVNTHGEVFEANLGDVEDDELPTLSGPPGSSAQLLQALQQLAPLYAGIGRSIETLSQSGRGSWRAELDNGARIELGRGSVEDLVERSQRFVGTVAPISGQYQRPVEYADLRHRDGYALRLKGVSTTLAAADKKTPGN